MSVGTTRDADIAHIETELCLGQLVFYSPRKERSGRNMSWLLEDKDLFLSLQCDTNALSRFST